MVDARFDFASDNTAGACPEAMAALAAHNGGFAAGYGGDAVTRQAADTLRAVLDTDADIRFVPSGTAANALACAALCRPFEAVAAHESAHICTDETGAPGFFGQGLGLTPLKGASGRIDLGALQSALARPPSPHHQAPAALSITNTTEFGTLYSGDAVETLTAEARRHGLGVHFDGARLANAAAAGFEVRRLKDLGVDILVFGGTKAGAPLSEAVVLFNPAVAHRFDARLKQAGQLASKGRMLSAPWLGLLQDDVWIRRARHANAMAQRLAEAMPFPIVHPVEANAVFVAMDAETLARLQKRGWFVYRFIDGSVRFMCSWATSEEALEALSEALEGVRR